MTAEPRSLAVRRPELAKVELHRPEEGWLPLGLLLVMALVLAWAIDAPAYVNGRGALTDCLPLCAALGVAFGFAGPKLGWGRWRTHLVGAVFAALLVPVFAGWAEAPGSSFADAFRLTANGTVQAYLDVAWRGRQFTSEEVHYTLSLGLIVWATAQFAAYAVYGHRRPFGAVVVMGLLLLGNMGLTRDEQLPHLVAFTAAALFLLIAMHALDERDTWLRRRIGDPATISSLYLRGGTVFIAVAVVASLFLTWRAASSPLAGAWQGVDARLVEAGNAVSRLFPIGGNLRNAGGVSFGSAARISGQWSMGNDIAFTATVPSETPDLYWRAATYDRFVLTGWEQGPVRRSDVAADAPLLDGSAEEAPEALTREIDVTVRPDHYYDRLLLSPGTPVDVNRASTVLLTGDEGWFAGAEVPSASQGYAVTARLLRLSDTDVISGNRLLAASEDYPSDVVRRYTEVPAGAIGPAAQKLLTDILATARSRDPYDLATAMESYLKSPSHFRYSSDVRGLCDTTSAVECFAQTRQGYCLHYASAMAILLRAANPGNPIPTRLVQGFLPGARRGDTEVVRTVSAHAWVEVFFPGYGWIPFDPTGGGVGRGTPIAAGPPVASTTPGPSRSGSAQPDGSREASGRPGQDRDFGAGVGTGSRPADRSLFVVLALLLAVLVGAGVVAAWVRGPRGEVSPDRAWQTLSRGASRFGFARRPTQTVYEYASALGELVPVARADLQTVADAKVETSYARATLEGDRLRAVREATRRLRLSLLRLVVRRARRPRRR